MRWVEDGSLFLVSSFPISLFSLLPIVIQSLIVAYGWKMANEEDGERVTDWVPFILLQRESDCLMEMIKLPS